MIAAIYARKSTDQHVADEEKSVTRQVERARAYSERKGWTVDPAAIFVDDGASGADFVRREGFLRLMNALRPRPTFQVLVMMEQSRLGRSLDEVPYAIRQITRAGVQIHFYLTDTEAKRDTAVDRFQSSVLAFVDEMHREQSRQRTRDALRRHAERGYVAGGLVYGYRNVEVRHGDKRSHVLREIHPVQAEVVRRIFREIARGDGFCRIAKRLNAEAVPAPRPRRGGWAPSGVRELALRDLYRGRLVYGKTRWVDRDREDAQGVAASAKRKVDMPPSEWITVEVPDLRIVDDPLWASAHARLAATRATYARLTDGRLVGRPAADRGPGHLLTGFLRCRACDGPVFCKKTTTTKGGTHLDYVCATQWTRGMCPSGLRIDREALDAAVLDAVERAILSPDRVADLVDRVLTRAAHGPDPAERRLVLERQLGEARARVERYVVAIGDGMDLAEIRAKLAEAKARAQQLEVELAGLGGSAAPVIDRKAVERRVADWRGILRRGPVVARQILRKIFPGARPITLSPTTGGVAFAGAAAGASILAGLANLSMVVPPG